MILQTNHTQTAQPPPPGETASERDEPSILRKIIGNNADYYLPQFEAINAKNPSKYNWAACLGGLFHATYRGVWHQWFRFMKLPLVAFGGSILVATLGAGLSSPTAIMMAGLLALLSSGLSFVWLAFCYPKQFNRIYFEHVTKKICAQLMRDRILLWDVLSSPLSFAWRSVFSFLYYSRFSPFPCWEQRIQKNPQTNLG